MRAWWAAVGIGALAIAGWQWMNRPIRYPAGVFRAGAPLQISDESLMLDHNGVTLHSRARYVIEARVVAKARYRTSTSAKFAPLDLGLVWGRVADQAVIDKLHFSSEDRFLWASWPADPPLPANELFESIGNIHVIPADGGIERELHGLKIGQYVRLEGYLVDVSGPGGSTWRTSLTRTDTGPGACEVMFVRRVRLIEPTLAG